MFYYDGATDPYTNGNSGAALGQVQGAIDALIPSTDYDIGHLFMYSGGGLANVNVPCNDTNKARGVTGVFNLASDFFYISYVAHEIGHQFGAHHTQNNSCQRTAATAMEPGSGSTIMGYAGICSPNVQGDSDDYFHAVSIGEILEFVVNGNGNSCDTPIASGNSAPTVSAVPNYTIPVSTPFVLEASASDANGGDVLTYCWEQMDNGIGVHPPVSTATDSPIFRSFQPEISPARYFPRLSDLTTNTDYDWEELPSVSRDLNFRCTVRDNASPNGCTDEVNMVVTTEVTSGPFLVSAPNTARTYDVGACMEVIWDVANTSVAPVNATSMDIFLSTDGGLTYPVTLATNVPNDGFASVITPNQPTTQGRVMVKATNNIFFDISDTDFVIQTGPVGFDLCRSTNEVAICTGDNATLTMDVPSVSGFGGNVTLSASNLPGGSTATFSNNPVSAGGQTTLTVSNTGALAEGVYTIDVTGMGSSGSETTSFDLIVSDGANAPVATTPADAATELSFFPTLTWMDDPLASSFELQLASDPAFNNIVFTTTTLNNTVDVPNRLSPSTTYYWRLRASNDCGTGSYSTARSFTTHGCYVYTYSGGDIPISSTQSGTYVATLNIPDDGTIEDINIIDIVGQHDRMKNLRYTVKHDGYPNVVLYDRQDCRMPGTNFDFSFDDDSPNANGSIPCPADDGLSYQPVGSLANYHGLSINGDWTLEIYDGGANFGGTFQSWSVEVCPDNFQSNTVVLPVVMTDLRLTPIDNAHFQIDWTTQVERNNRGFEIQRREGTTGTFNPVHWTSGRGDSDEAQHYRWADRDVERGVQYYYRIKQVDRDEVYTYSDVVTGKLGQDLGSVRFFPNPARNKLTLETTGEAITIAVEIFDLHGRRLHLSHFAETRREVDLSDYPQGVYLMQITSGTTTRTHRIVKQ